MKSVLALLVAASISAPALALDVNRNDVNAANQPARELSTTESLTMRFKLNWARVALFQLNKNEKMFDLVGAQGGQAKKIAIALTETAVVGGLMVATEKFAKYEAARDARGIQYITNLGGYRRRKLLKELQADAKNLDQQVATGTRPVGAMYSGDVRKGLKIEGDMDTWMRAREREFRVSPIQRTARGLRLVLAAGLVLTLAEDMGKTWIQITMTPEEVEQKKVDLQNTIHEYEQQLAANGTQE